MTVDELMSIADEYADAKVEDYAFHGDVKARNLHDKLRTAIEELHRDAAMQSEIDELREKLAALTRINSDLCSWIAHLVVPCVQRKID